MRLTEARAKLASSAVEGPILLVVEVPDNMKGGMARQFRFIGEAIARKGYSVDFLFLEDMPRSLSPRLSGFTLDVCRRAISGVIKRVKSLPTPSVILWSVNSVFPFGMVRHYWSRVSSVPLIGLTFGVEERWWPQLLADAAHSGGPPVHWLQRFTTGWLRLRVLSAATKACDHVVCVSREDRRYIVERYGLSAERVTATTVGVAPEFLDVPLRRGDGSRILFVGTWIWRKGIKFLVEALTSVLRTEQTGMLSLVGAFKDPSVVLADWPADVRSKIRVVPELDGTSMVQEYMNHDIFVLPSLFEGMPLSLAEAMAAGMAVVTTATCGMLDLINDRHNGLAVPTRDSGALAEAILEIMRNPSLRQSLGTRARETMRAMTWDAIADQFLDVFWRAGSGSPRGLAPRNRDAW